MIIVVVEGPPKICLIFVQNAMVADIIMLRGKMKKIILPISWKQISSPIPYQKAFIKFNGLVVMVGEMELEGDMWLHVSCSHKDKLPKWKEISEVKKIFIGPDKKAIQVFPAESEHVNIMPYCLHLWHNLDRDVLPDFTMGMGTI